MRSRKRVRRSGGKGKYLVRLEVLKKLTGSETVLLKSVDSTNSFAKSRSFENSALIIANEQTMGRGRNGKTFLSPEGGLYMSIVFGAKDGFSAGAVTAAAAVAVVRAIKKVFDIQTSIKWVNDIILGGKKVCGILCESETADGAIGKVIVGVGINLLPSPSLPYEATHLAASVSQSHREMLAATVYNEFFALYSKRDFFKEYKNNCETLGKKIIVRAGGEYFADAVSLTDDFSLIIERDGQRQTLSFGEVSVCKADQ